MTDAQMAGVIRSMTDGLTPVAPLRSVRARAGLWSALSMLSLSIVAWSLGLRRDLAAAALSSQLELQVLTMGILAAVAGVAALRLSVPGADRPAGRIAALGILGLWPCALLAWCLVEGATATSLATEPLHLTCMRTIAMVALVPTIAMTVMIRRGAPMRPGWAVAMAGLAAAGAGAVGVTLTCPISRVPHLLIAHALPTVVVAVTLGVAMSWAVRGRRSSSHHD
jgi:hypothetical protein